MSEHYSTIIIGAGLSGLYTAWRLHQQGQDVIVLEANNRIGGRILSSSLDDDVLNYKALNHNDSNVDMGPAWVWPELQPRLQKLLSELNLNIFQQFTEGDIIYESVTEKIERYSGQSAHNQSYRIAGGAQKLIEQLRSRLPETTVQLQTQVTTITQTPLGVQTKHQNKPRTYTCDRVVLALPPRITLQNIEFIPALPKETTELWRQTTTWMAAQCKILFIYDRPFWREQKLSGEVFSQLGPLTEIYDGSPANDEFFALTSFVGLSAAQRAQFDPSKLITLCLLQLQRLFGELSQNTIDIQIKDWSKDQLVATDIDINTPPKHPEYPKNAPRHIWEKKIILAGTEVACEHGGYLEGALESADEAVSLFP